MAQATHARLGESHPDRFARGARRLGARRLGARRLGALAGAIVAAAAPTVVQAQDAEELVVTSSMIALPERQIGTAVSVITGEEMQLRGYDSLVDVLRTQPGIGVSNNGGPGKATTLRIRGEEGHRTMLMIDGVKAVDPTATQVTPNFATLLTTSDLARVEVLRGPQGFMYGADAGGVVSLFTRRGEGEVEIGLGLEAGELGTRKLEASVSGGSDAGDYYVAVTDFETDGFNSRADDTALRDDDGADNTTLHAKLGWNASERLRLQLVARDIDADTQYDNCFSGTTVHDCRSTNAQTTFKLSAELDGDRVTHGFGYSDVHIERADFALGAFSFGADGGTDRLEYWGSYRPSEGATLVYGADLATESVADAGARRERDQDGYYFEYQGNHDERFFFTVGARYDDNEDFGSHTSSRATAAYLQDLGGDRTLKYRASYGTGFRAPSLFEISYNSDPVSSFPPAFGFALHEEQSAGYDVGIEYFGAAGLQVGIGYFDQEIDDAIFFDLVDFSGYLQESGISTSTGFEVTAEAPLGDRFAIIGNWTRNDAETFEGSPRLRRPETLGNVGVRYRSQALRLFASYRIQRDAIDVGSVALDDYEVLDLSATYALNDTFELFGRVENALDEDYIELAGFNTSGRAVYAGLRLRF